MVADWALFRTEDGFNVPFSCLQACQVPLADPAEIYSRRLRVVIGAVLFS